MDLLQLEHFLAVVEEGTFTRAAERVSRTQPAVSQSIKKLEEEVGAPLFARDVHEVSLTEAGRVLADYARRIVNLRNEAVHQASEREALQGLMDQVQKDVDDWLAHYRHMWQHQLRNLKRYVEQKGKEH